MGQGNEQKVRPGDRVRIPAQTWNSIIDSVKRSKLEGFRSGLQQPVTNKIASVNTILIENTLSTDLEAFRVVGLQQVVLTLDEDSKFDVNRRMAIDVYEPTGPEGNFGITQAPIAQNEMGTIAISGMTVAYVKITDTDHTWANPVAGETGYLESTADCGQARIIDWADSEEEDPDVKLAIVMIVGGCSGEGNHGFHARLEAGLEAGPWDIQPIARGLFDWVDVGDPILESTFCKAWHYNTNPNPDIGDIVWVIPSVVVPAFYEFIAHPNYNCGLCFDQETDTYTVDVEQLAGERASTGLVRKIGGGAGIGCESGSGSGSGSGSDGSGSGSGDCDSLGVDLECDEDFEFTADEITGISAEGASISISVRRSVVTGCKNLAGDVVDLNVSTSDESYSITLNTDFLCDCCQAEDPAVDPSSEGPTGNCCFAFAANASGGTPPYLYQWDFDDGITSSEENPSHCFSQAGVYEVTVTVTDACGKTAQGQVTVECVEPLTTLCCPDNPIEAGLYAHIMSGIFAGTYPIMNVGGGFPTWNFTLEGGAFGDCPQGGVYAPITLKCNEIGQWELYTDDVATGPFVTSGASCNPFSLTFDNVEWLDASCGTSSGITVVIDGNP